MTTDAALLLKLFAIIWRKLIHLFRRSNKRPLLSA